MPVDPGHICIASFKTIPEDVIQILYHRDITRLPVTTFSFSGPQGDITLCKIDIFPGYSEPVIEKHLKKHTAKQQLASNVIETTKNSQQRASKLTKRVNIDSDPRLYTTERLKEIEAELDRHEQGLQKRTKAILELEGRKRLTEKGLDILISSGSDLVKPFYEHYPFSESIIKVFEKSLSKIISNAAELNIVQPLLQ